MQEIGVDFTGGLWWMFTNYNVLCIVNGFYVANMHILVSGVRVLNFTNFQRSDLCYVLYLSRFLVRIHSESCERFVWQGSFKLNLLVCVYCFLSRNVVGMSNPIKPLHIMLMGTNL